MHDLQRFVEAQEPVYAAVLAELASGMKRSHWMWFVFPQLRGLGHSAMAQFYGIASEGEAVAYARHALLGARLREATQLVLDAPAAATAHTIFGSPDDLKFCSCMTLFAQAAAEPGLFNTALDRFFAGLPDARTLALLGQQR